MKLTHSAEHVHALGGSVVYRDMWACERATTEQFFDHAGSVEVWATNGVGQCVEGSGVNIAVFANVHA